jgi:glycosyltransferase involved in cell wall biosynthesis
MTTLSVIIPAFNEESGITRIIERVLAIREPLERAGALLELIVVDDGSRDRTKAQVALYPDVRLIRHAVNRGYGAAIKTGFRQASGQYLAFLDADGTYPPESLPEMFRTAVQQRADLVIGSRMSGARSEMPPTRRVGNLAFAALLSLIGNVSVRDTTSGMRVLRRDVLPLLYPLPDGLQFTPAMSTRAIHENLHIVEFPIAYAERVGRSKLSVVHDGFQFTNAIVWTALAYNPVRILGMLSLAAIGTAGAIGLYFLALRLSGITTLTAPQVYALFGAALLTVTGISLFTLGAMFNYLVALFHKGPVRQGLFGKPIFHPPLDNHFGWMGIAAVLAGLTLGAGSFVVSMGGWEISRVWFYLLISAMLIISGLQLSIAWIVMRILEELAQREVSVRRDLTESGTVPDEIGGVLSRSNETG